jgi:hypothetical protein
MRNCNIDYHALLPSLAPPPKVKEGGLKSLQEHSRIPEGMTECWQSDTSVPDIRTDLANISDALYVSICGIFSDAVCVRAA